MKNENEFAGYRKDGSRITLADVKANPFTWDWHCTTFSEFGSMLLQMRADISVMNNLKKQREAVGLN